MMDMALYILPVLAFCAHIYAFVALMLGRTHLGIMLTSSGVFFLACTAVINWSQVHRLPVYSLYETCLHTSLVLALCLLGWGLKQPRPEVTAWGNVFLALLLGLAISVLGQFNHDFYMYQAWSVQLFFALRLTAAGILLFSFLLFTSVWVRGLKAGANNGSSSMRPATASLLLAGVCFLSSELSGTIWCVLGWGDTWHWSSNFFQSAKIFLLLMLPLHIPQDWKKTSLRAGSGSLCTLAAALAIMLP